MCKIIFLPFWEFAKKRVNRCNMVSIFKHFDKCIVKRESEREGRVEKGREKRLLRMYLAIIYIISLSAPINPSFFFLFPLLLKPMADEAASVPSRDTGTLCFYRPSIWKDTLALRALRIIPISRHPPKYYIQYRSPPQKRSFLDHNFCIVDFFTLNAYSSKNNYANHLACLIKCGQ